MTHQLCAGQHLEGAGQASSGLAAGVGLEAAAAPAQAVVEVLVALAALVAAPCNTCGAEPQWGFERLVQCCPKACLWAQARLIAGWEAAIAACR